MRKASSSIGDVVSQFITRLAALIEKDAVSRARDAVLSAFNGSAPSAGSRRGRASSSVRRGRPPGAKAKSPQSARPKKGAAKAVRKRRKGPIQLCPVPGCTNRAAPLFGMVCAQHKDLPRAEIDQHREARRAEKAAS